MAAPGKARVQRLSSLTLSCPRGSAPLWLESGGGGERTGLSRDSIPAAPPSSPLSLSPPPRSCAASSRAGGQRTWLGGSKSGVPRTEVPPGGPLVLRSSQGAPTALSGYTAPAGRRRPERSATPGRGTGAGGARARARALWALRALEGARCAVALPGSAVAEVASYPRLLSSASARRESGG